MTRIQNILVGVDLHHADRLAASELSAETQAAVSEALLLAVACEGTVTFCSVLELSAQSQSLIEHDHENILKTVEDIANLVLTRLVNHANHRGIAAESVLRFGPAWQELSKEAATGQYDMAIVGSRSNSGTFSMLFGSTAKKLMRFSPCPVWVVKPAELRDVRDVAIATDLSPRSMPAFHMAVTVTRIIGARLHVLHVLEQDDLRYLSMAGVADEELARTEARLRQTADEELRTQLHQTDFRTLPLGVKIEYLVGTTDVAILDYVSTNQIDLLVMGTQGRTQIPGLLLGNTAEQILPGLHASLLVVKPSGFKSPYAS